MIQEQWLPVYLMNSSNNWKTRFTGRKIQKLYTTDTEKRSFQVECAIEDICVLKDQFKILKTKQEGAIIQVLLQNTGPKKSIKERQTIAIAEWTMKTTEEEKPKNENDCFYSTITEGSNRRMG